MCDLLVVTKYRLFTIKSTLQALSSEAFRPGELKPLDFLMFSGGIEKQHRAVMG